MRERTQTHLDLAAQGAHLLEAPRGATPLLDLLLVAVEPQAVPGVGACVGDAACGGEGAEVVLREGDGEGRVGREDELRVALAPAVGGWVTRVSEGVFVFLEEARGGALLDDAARRGSGWGHGNEGRGRGGSGAEVSLSNDDSSAVLRPR